MFNNQYNLVNLKDGQILTDILTGITSGWWYTDMSPLNKGVNGPCYWTTLFFKFGLFSICFFTEAFSFLSDGNLLEHQVPGREFYRLPPQDLSAHKNFQVFFNLLRHHYCQFTYILDIITLEINLISEPGANLTKLILTRKCTRYITNSQHISGHP